MDQHELLVKHVVPALGDVVALMMFFSPLKAVLTARRHRTLGSFNPLPVVAMWANCTAWLVYAFKTSDPYVLIPNCTGLLLATFMTLACYGLADDKVRDNMLKLSMFFSTVLVVAGTVVSFGGFEAKQGTTIWGYATVFILVVYYSAPLSVVAEVVATRNSAPLHKPLAAMSFVNGSLWTVYGLAVGDVFIWGPNAVGGVFGVVQLMLCWALPSSKAAGENADRDDEMEPDSAALLRASPGGLG